jgi:hypothetical protein
VAVANEVIIANFFKNDYLPRRARGARRFLQEANLMNTIGKPSNPKHWKDKFINFLLSVLRALRGHPMISFTKQGEGAEEPGKLAGSNQFSWNSLVALSNFINIEFKRTSHRLRQDVHRVRARQIDPNLQPPIAGLLPAHPQSTDFPQ